MSDTKIQLLLVKSHWFWIFCKIKKPQIILSAAYDEMIGLALKQGLEPRTL